MKTEEAIDESTREENDINSDDLFSNQIPASATPAKEESEKMISSELTKASNTDPTINSKSTTETIISEATVASKKPTSRSISSSVEQQDAGVAVDSYKVNTDDLYNKGIRAYKNKKYLTAISYLEKCIDKPEAQFLYGC
ncbi:MAG: hypothetical protein IPK10_12975 [Bacteroidetes bacterium]|nr:hypothetical protein [Bacteroidota bacterium]